MPPSFRFCLTKSLHPPQSAISTTQQFPIQLMADNYVQPSISHRRCAMNRISSITAKQMFDPFPDASYLEAEGFQERRQQYDNGDFGFIGIQAEAEIVVAGVCQTITSGGLWGIESDSTPDYLSEVEQEEIEQLQEVLHALGFSRKSFQNTCKGARYERTTLSHLSGLPRKLDGSGQSCTYVQVAG